MPIVDRDGPLEMPLRRFFRDARERFTIKLKKEAGQPAPWTDDPVMRGAYLCNVHREDDRVTRWFREHVREPMRGGPEVLLATVVFRWFTRVDVGEALFCAPDLDGVTAFDVLHRSNYRWQTQRAILRRAISDHVGSGPYVTGAYIISTPPGMSKLDGVIENIRGFVRHEFGAAPHDHEPINWRYLAECMLTARIKYTLREAHEILRAVPYLGPFHAYEIVTDLRHTALLDRAPDTDTWANIGPGCRRGLRRVVGKDPGDAERCLRHMRKILQVARAGAPFWPREWPRWEMREVEHWLCEFDKIERARERGLGSLKRRYRHGGA